MIHVHAIQERSLKSAVEMFEIGQKVVCIKPTGNQIKYGEIFLIKAMRNCCCSLNLDIGIRFDDFPIRCIKCHEIFWAPIRWYKASRFVPLDEFIKDIDISELIEILEPQKEFVKI